MIVTLTGKNLLAIAVELNRIQSIHQKAHGANTIERYDGSDLDSTDYLLDAVRSISFLEPKKLVIVRDFFQSSKIIEGIETIVGQVAESTDLILVDAKLDKRSKVYSFLKNKTDFKSFEELSPYLLEKWVQDTAHENNAEIAIAEVRMLIDLVGTNQQHLESEIRKLSLYTKVISEQAITALVEPTPQSKIFTMLDALFNGQSKRAWELYQDQRAQGIEHQQIIAMITWQLQQLALAVLSPQKTESSLTSAGMSPYGAKKSLQLARRMTKQDLRFYVSSLADIDYLIKTSADGESALETFFSEVALKYQGSRTVIS